MAPQIVTTHIHESSMAACKVARSQHHRIQRHVQDESSDEEDPKAASMDVVLLAQAALAMEDLGNARRDYITSIDHTRATVNLARLDKIRTCNVNGTEAAKAAQQHSVQMSAWNNPASFGGNVGPDSADIGHGQSHRERITRDVKIERAAMQQREYQEYARDSRGKRGEQGLFQGKNFRGKKTKYSPKNRPLDPALHEDDSYDPLAEVQTRLLRARSAGSLVTDTGRGKSVSPKAGQLIGSRNSRKLKNRDRARTHARPHRPAFDPLRLQSNPVAATEAATAIKCLLEQRKIGAISHEDFEKIFWDWRMSKISGNEHVTGSEGASPKSVSLIAPHQNISKAEEKAALKSPNEQPAQVMTDLEYFDRCRQDHQSKDASNHTNITVDSQRPHKQPMNNPGDGGNPTPSSKLPELSHKEPPHDSANSAAARDSEESVQPKASFKAINVEPNRNNVDPTKQISGPTSSLLRSKFGPSVSDVTARLRALSITDIPPLRNPFSSSSVSLIDESDSEKERLLSPSLIPSLPRKIPPEEIIFEGHKYRISDYKAATPETFQNPFRSAHTMEYETVKNTFSSGPSTVLPEVVLDTVARGNSACSNNRNEVLGRNVDGLGKKKPAASHGSGLEASMWCTQPQAPANSPSSLSSLRLKSPRKYHKEKCKTQHIDGGAAFLNLVKDMEARGNSHGSVTAKSYRGIRLPLSVLDQIQSVPPKA